MDEEIMKVHGKIDWEHKSNAELLILCSLTKDARDVNKLKKDWNANVKKSVKSFVTTRVKVEKRQCLKKVWPEICAEVDRLRTSNKKVAIIPCESETTLYVVGPPQTITSIYDDLDKMSTDIEKKMDNINDVIELNGLEKAILEKLRFHI